MRDLRRAAETDPSYPALLFFYQGTSEEGAAFFGSLWPEARAIADPARDFYRQFGLARGGRKELLSPSVVACSIRAATKGNFGGRPQGDTRQMPGLFLVEGNQIVWQHDYRHAGDLPDFARLAEQLRQFQPVGLA